MMHMRLPANQVVHATNQSTLHWLTNQQSVQLYSWHLFYVGHKLIAGLGKQEEKCYKNCIKTIMKAQQAAFYMFSLLIFC